MAFVFYFLAILTIGLGLLFQDIREELRNPARNPLPSWNAAVLEFLLFAVMLILLYMLLGSMAAVVTEDWRANPILKPWRIPVIAFASQAGMFLTFIFTFHPRFKRLITFEAPETVFAFSPVQLNFGEILNRGIFAALASFPLMLAVGKGWETVLQWINDLGYSVSMDRQALLDLFEEDSGTAVSIALILLAVIVAPITEELVFRGGIYRYLKGRFSPRSAMIISSALFGLIHLNLLATLPLFLLGMLLCRAYEKSQSILVPIVFHAVFNANSIISLILASNVDAIP